MTFEAMTKMRVFQRVYHMMWNDDGSERLRSLIEMRFLVSLKSARASSNETVLHTGRCRLQATKSSLPHLAFGARRSVSRIEWTGPL